MGREDQVPIVNGGGVSFYELDELIIRHLQEVPGEALSLNHLLQGLSTGVENIPLDLIIDSLDDIVAIFIKNDALDFNISEACLTRKGGVDDARLTNDITHLSSSITGPHINELRHLCALLQGLCSGLDLYQFICLNHRLLGDLRGHCGGLSCAPCGGARSDCTTPDAVRKLIYELAPTGIGGHRLRSLRCRGQEVHRSNGSIGRDHPASASLGGDLLANTDRIALFDLDAAICQVGIQHINRLSGLGINGFDNHIVAIA